MDVPSVLYLLAFLGLQASSATLKRENITVLEGESVVLNCTMDRIENSSIEWTNPKRHVLYFNNIRGIRDRRYNLVHYSKAKLFITLVNTTVEDDGVYTCLYYNHPVISKEVYLTVLAPPSPPVLNITTRLLKGKEEKVVSCITTGSKPKPQITWLLNNRLELRGHTEYNPENKGTKFTTISMLNIKAHDQESRVDCLVRHESLMNKVLRVTYRFDNHYNSLGLTEIYSQTTNEINPTSTTESATTSELFESVTLENSTENISTVNYDFLTSTEDSMLFTNGTESSLNSTSSTEILIATTGQSTFQIKEESSTSVSEMESSLTSTPSMELSVTESEQNISQDKIDLFNSSYSKPYNSSENNTEANEWAINSTTVWNLTTNSSLEQENPNDTVKCENNQSIENNEKPEKLRMKRSSALLLILIAFLICGLLIVFQLFVLKIRKEHLKWRKQKDDSDLTVESNKSNRSSNEENVRPENNNREPNFANHYTVQVHSEGQMKQYMNSITEDQINTLDKESTV
ncbi:cytotoxic and regulatory T-cell molecule isoform X1 [Hemiscyllium ocellatum]|uniref:cytotoxic and regulatory T-cell molecule isoform X1 n=1 Tax=Hemiscyllium ocellatum TaxID=170820 RepID=UPI0029660103|nr:cytotoxic and regulatory T-cell molecule isoform X1 [Hemiscyllium ocellatum]